MQGYPTVNRRTTDSHTLRNTKDKTTRYSRLDSLSIVSRQSDLAMYVARIAAVVALLVTLGIGNAWGYAYLKGSWDSWTNHDISGGSCEVTLPANTEYEFGIDVDGSFYSYTNQNFTNTSTSFQLYTGNGNCKITTGEAGTYIFKTWYDNGRYMAVYFPQARLVKQKYIYFDVRNQTNWNSSNFDARFWFKYYDSGGDNGSADCEKGDALENWVYYALVPDHDYIGQIQMNRLNPSNHDDVWCTANIAYAKDRTASAQNCLKEESGKADYCIYWTPQWTTYCPPMSSVTLADNGTTTWGGNGAEGTPYLVPTEGDIKVHVTASASALDDANMTKYFLFKKAGSAVGSGSSSTDKTITASGTTGTKEAVIVEAYNYYNSTEGTHLASSAIYYEARTPYTISYNAGTGGSGSRASETKLKGVNFTLPNSAVFTRTGYTQTGWTTSDGGSQTHALGGSYTSDAAQAFYPAWTANEYTVTLNNLEATTAGTESVTATYDATLSAITPPTKDHYDFGGYWTSSNGGSTLTTQIINSDGTWKKNVSGYTGASGDNPTWVYANDITLYAKWTEHPYTITLAVDPTGAGTVQIGGNAETSVYAHWVTESAEITAVPASPAYIFKQWQFSKTGGEYDVFVSDDETYHSTDATIKIKASHNGTLTAIFEPRYCLVGSLLNNDLAGMPGWSDYDNSATFFTVNSLDPLNLTCARTLHPNSTYKFEVHDRKAGANYGYGDGTYVLNAESSQSFNVSNADVRINTTAYGIYTFTITGITETDGKYYPTVTVARPANPRRVYFGWGHAEIDATGTVNSGNTGGSLAIQTTESDDSHFDITESGQWAANGCNVTYTATAQTGYTLTWYSENTYTTAFDPQPDASWTHSSISGDDNVYAKFTEVSTAVTLNNDGHGKVQINSTDQTSTTCGVTTTRQLNAVPNSGYSFSSWSKTGSDISLSATDTNPTTLTGGGSGTSSQSVTANFSANNYTITLDDKHGGTTSASVTYDATSLTSITHATFSGWTLLGYWNTDGNKVIEANGDIVANVVNYTDASHKWNYANNVTLYAHWSRSITLDKKEGSSSGSVTVNYDESTTASLSVPSRTGYHVEGYYAETGLTTKVMNPDGTLVANVSGYTNSSSEWVHATATTLYTKWAPNEYTVTLDPREVESGDEGTPSVTVYYETSTNMTSAITKPTKAHYTFLGYYTGYDDVKKVVTGSKLIDGNGNWIKDVTGFTGHDGDNPTWVYVGNYTLYADWTETMYPVAIAISPAGAGNVQVSGETVTEVTAGYATHSPEMTAVPANAAWVFKEWQVSSASLSMDLEHYTTTGTSMQVISVAADQTLTAVFEPRYELVGSVWDGSSTGGMPGWEYDGTGDFTFNSFTAVDTDNGVDLSYSCTLTSNTAYKLRINDKGASAVYGKNDPTYDYYTLPANTSAELSDYGEGSEDVWIQTGEASGLFTFRITKMRNAGAGNRYYPTLSVDRPQQVHVGWKYINIGGSLTAGDVGGTVAVTKQSDGSAVANGTWLTYGTAVTYTATPTSGYTVNWFGNSEYSGDPFSTSYSFNHDGTSTGNGYAKFIENATSVTLSNDGHGKIQIGGVDATSTTCGVTTTRELTAVPNDGYKFSSWTHVSGDDITLSSTSTNPTTLTGRGGGVSSGQEVRANFIERWIVQPEVGEWGYLNFTIEHIEEVGGKTIGYVDITLAANTNYQFSVVDRDGDVKYKNGSDKVYYMTNGNSHNWGFATDKSYYCGITTAGAGVYRFTWNITDKKMTVTYPNFVIYRTGDKAGDERATEDDVESYEGGTIAKAIEFRMRVNRLDKWYTLCLPFTVTAVKVWDEDDGQYYDIVPYWRTGGTYYTGHYIIRTPVSTTDFAIENFDSRDRWVDPSSPDGYLPSKNTPYIIQWHDSYFEDRYISFFSPTGQTIPTSMNTGSNSCSDETVNIYGNNCMTSGTVQDAYMLDPDYGSGGAWMREDVGTDRTVLPFECFIRANAATTAKHRILRPDADDPTTGYFPVTENPSADTRKVLIDNRIYIIRGDRIYTLEGTLVEGGM